MFRVNLLVFEVIYTLTRTLIHRAELFRQLAVLRREVGFCIEQRRPNGCARFVPIRTNYTPVP